ALVGHRHDDEERRIAGIGAEPHLAADQPVIAVAYGLGGEHARVGPALGFGHGEAGDNLVIEQRFEVFALLLLTAVVGENFAVARIRRVTAEHDRREQCAAEYFVDQGQAYLAVSRPAQLRTKMTGPEFARLDLRL